MNGRTRLAASLLLPLALAACAKFDREDKDSDVQMSMDQLPAAVRTTLEREAAGGKVGEIEKEMKDGRTFYCADVTLNGQDWDIEIDESGKVVSKEKD
jgi:uncharacterized membrane protein YkoI